MAAGNNVLFQTIEYSSGNISYNPATGVVTFNQADAYIVSFGISTDGLVNPTPPNTVGFAIATSQGDFVSDYSAITSGTVGRTAIIDVAVAPVTMSLVNAAPNTVNLAAVPTNGWLTVTGSTQAIRLSLQSVGVT